MAAVVSEAEQEEEWHSEMVHGPVETTTMTVASLSETAAEHCESELVASPCETVLGHCESSSETMRARAPATMPTWSTQKTSQSESQRFCVPFWEGERESCGFVGLVCERGEMNEG